MLIRVTVRVVHPKITLGFADDEKLSTKLKIIQEFRAGKLLSSILENQYKEDTPAIAAKRYANLGLQSNKVAANIIAIAAAVGTNVSENPPWTKRRTSHTLLQAERTKRAAVVALVVHDQILLLHLIPILDTGSSRNSHSLK